MSALRRGQVNVGLVGRGAVGNLVDRLFRQPAFARGEVVDFIAYGDWFVGNVADIAIVAAAGLMVLLGMRGIGIDGRRLDAVSKAAEGAEATVSAEGAEGAAALDTDRAPAERAADPSA